MHTEELFYREGKIRLIAVQHAGEAQWEGWSGICMTGRDQFMACYGGLMDLQASREEALTVAIHAAMVWIDLLMRESEPCPVGCTLPDHVACTSQNRPQHFSCRGLPV